MTKHTKKKRKLIHANHRTVGNSNMVYDVIVEFQFEYKRENTIITGHIQINN